MKMPSGFWDGFFIDDSTLAKNETAGRGVSREFMPHAACLRTALRLQANSFTSSDYV